MRTELLAGLNCKVWVDDIVWWGADEDDMLNILDKILGRFATAHKCLLFDIEISWCGTVYSGGQVFHDRKRLSGLASMRRPQTADKLMQSLQAANWLRTPLPPLGEVVKHLRVLLEEQLGGIQRRTKRVASNQVTVEEAWKREQVATWSNAQNLVANAVALQHPKDGFEMAMFPDTFDNHWGSFLTQVPKAEFDGGVEMEKMSHEPLGFLSSAFCGSQQRWAIVDKEVFCHHEHVSPLRVLAVGRSAHLHRPPQLGLHFRTRGVRFVGVKDCSAATRDLEDGCSSSTTTR